MAVVWNGYETGKKIYKTHPDGLPAQYNAFRQVLSQFVQVVELNQKFDHS